MREADSVKNDDLVISDYYNGLTKEQKIFFRDSIMKAMEISMATFYYRMRTGRFKGIERDYIFNKLINKPC